MTSKQGEKGARGAAKQNISGDLLEERHDVITEGPGLANGSGVFGCGLDGSGGKVTGGWKEQGLDYRELPIRQNAGRVLNNQRLCRGQFETPWWLGDRENPRRRVQTHIATAELDRIESTCRTPGRMAEELLDCLFAQQSQPGSDPITIMKKGRKRLNPELIYGIWCHLKRRFTMSKPEWKEIRTSMKAKFQAADGEGESYQRRRVFVGKKWLGRTHDQYRPPGSNNCLHRAPGPNDWKKLPYVDLRLNRCRMCSEKRRYKYKGYIAHYITHYIAYYWPILLAVYCLLLAYIAYYFARVLPIQERDKI